MAEQALIMPKVGESVTEGTILHWLKQDGDMVEEDEPVVEVETEKVNVEIPSQWAGRLRITAQEGDIVKVEEPLAYVETDSTAARHVPVVPSRTARGEPGRTTNGGPKTVPVAVTAGRGTEGGPAAGASAANGNGANRYSPAVLNLARENEVDLTQLSGSGLLGRITRKDVLAYLEGRSSGAVTAPTAARAIGPPPEAAPASSQEVLPLTATRRTIAERMVRSAQSIPHVWLMMEADVTGLVRLRQRLRDEFREREGVDLTYLPFVIRAAVEGLKDFPILNSSWSDEGIVLKKDINIGVAVATDAGLIVPVVHHAADLSIAGIARRVADLAERARSRKLRIEDVDGGTFTVDNTGAFGSIVSMPIINHPQAAIMTIEAIVKRPVVVNDAIAIRSMVNLCMSFDHRVLDGAQAGQFLTAVKKYLEAIDENSHPA